MGVDVTEAITPSPSPAGTAVRRLRNSPARAASQAYRATMICTTTNGQKVGLRSVFTADVMTPVAIPTAGPGRAVAGGRPLCCPQGGRAARPTAGGGGGGDGPRGGGRGPGGGGGPPAAGGG